MAVDATKFWKLLTKFEKAVLSHNSIMGHGNRRQAFIKKEAAKTALVTAYVDLEREISERYR